MISQPFWDLGMDEESIRRAYKRKPKKIRPINVGARTPESTFSFSSSPQEERESPHKPLRPVIQEGPFTIYSQDPHKTSRVVRDPKEKKKRAVRDPKEKKKEEGMSAWEKMRKEKRRRRQRVMSGVRKVGGFLKDVFG